MESHKAPRGLQHPRIVKSKVRRLSYLLLVITAKLLEAEDMELLEGKARADAYSKRSTTIVEKVSLFSFTLQINHHFDITQCKEVAWPI